MQSKNKKGFTLIEVLVVIGIIAILSTVVMVAVNPARQFALARDTQRTSNLSAILGAIQQNMIENKGVFKCGTDTFTLPSTFASIEDDDVNPAGDIARCLIPNYLTAIPFDPTVPNGHYIDVEDYFSGYQIMRDNFGRIVGAAIGELQPLIQVSR